MDVNVQTQNYISEIVHLVNEEVTNEYTYYSFNHRVIYIYAFYFSSHTLYLNL